MSWAEFIRLKHKKKKIEKDKLSGSQSLSSISSGDKLKRCLGTPLYFCFSWAPSYVSKLLKVSSSVKIDKRYSALQEIILILNVLYEDLFSQIVLKYVQLEGRYQSSEISITHNYNLEKIEIEI